jgi:hypothetical protein
MCVFISPRPISWEDWQDDGWLPLREVASGVQARAICYRDEEVDVMVRASVWMSP